jgi:leader peptidase (prepilin peptidase)/N-methyltransferase
LDSIVLYFFAFVFGAIVGSFLNVCIYRLPQGLSIVEPPSHCFHCKEPIAWTDNIPLLSYLVLRGRCRHCGTSYSPRYFLVELLTGVLAVAVLWRFGLTPALVLYFVFVAALVVVTFIDVDHLIIPDAISLPSIGVGLTASFFVEGTPTPFESALGIVIGGGIVWAIATGYQKLTGIEGIGFGNVKLLAMIGAFLGWRGVPLCLLIGSLSGWVIGVRAMAILGKNRRWEIPSAPFLALGAVLTLLFGEQLTWYLGWSW